MPMQEPEARSLAHYRATVLGKWRLPNGQMLGVANAQYVRKLAEFLVALSHDLHDDAVIRNYVGPGPAEALMASVFGEPRE